MSNKEKLFQNITNSLLDSGLDLITFLQSKNNKLEDDIEEVYPEAIKHFKVGDSVKIGVDVYHAEDFLDYCKHVDMPPEGRYITLPKYIPMEDIENALQQQYGKSWKDLTQTEKNDVLWNCGMNTKDGRYYVDRRIYRNSKNKAVTGLCIVASERTDKGWTKTPFASYEAKIFTVDGSLSKELFSLQHGGN